MPTTIVLRSKRRERALAVQKLQHLLPAILLLHGIDWIDVFAASVIFVETLEHYHRTGHIVRPNVLMIATLLALFRPALKASWSALRSIEIGDRFAVIETRTGRTKRLDLLDIDNAEPVRAALGLARDRLIAGEKSSI